MFLGKYKSKKRLGRGGFGEVMLVADEQDTLYALKMISV